MKVSFESAVRGGFVVALGLLLVLAGVLWFGSQGWPAFLPLGVAAVVAWTGWLVRRDFRQRERLEQQLDRYFTLARNLFCIAGFDGYFKRVNPAWEKTLGWSSAELLAKPFLEFVHPDDREATTVAAQRLAGGREIVSFENRYRCKDGSYRWLLWSATPEPGSQLIAAVAHDVTERKRVEAELEHERYLLATLMDQLPDDIYFKDRAGRFLRNNRAHARRFGLADPAQAIGKTDFDFFSADHARQARADEEQVMATGQPLTKEEKETWPDGTATWALTTKLPLRDQQGQVVGTFGISRNITARKQAEEATRLLNMDLQRQSAQLASLNQELEAFSYSVSHDLRAPLRHLNGFLSLLVKHPAALDATQQRYLEVISRSAQRMGLLIDDLLSFSRMGRAELRWSRVNLAELVRETQTDLVSGLEGRVVQWQVQPLPEVQGDPAMLRQVLANLLGNALKYSRPRNPTVIEVGSETNADEEIVFVRDNGVGFDMQYVGKLFGVFQRLHDREEFEGTGIGLANVRRIISRHGGRTWAESRPGEGATFYFSLPRNPTTPAPNTSTMNSHA